jgi:hypothetical protein
MTCNAAHHFGTCFMRPLLASCLRRKHVRACTRPSCGVMSVSLGMYVSVTSSVSMCLPAESCMKLLLGPHNQVVASLAPCNPQ